MKKTRLVFLILWVWMTVTLVRAQANYPEEYLNPLTFKSSVYLMNGSFVKGVLHRVTQDSVWIEDTSSSKKSSLRRIEAESIQLIKVQKEGRASHGAKSGLIVGSVWGSSLASMILVGGGATIGGVLSVVAIPVVFGVMIGAGVGSAEWDKIPINGKKENLILHHRKLQEVTRYSSVKPRFYEVISPNP